jgi:MFS transporter, DHA1 family, multidrug resistance protein
MPGESPSAASWVKLLVLFSFASIVETSFAGQVFAFTPLYLPHLGVAQADIVAWTGAITAFTYAIGIPFLPFWGSLADRYARQPVIVRSYIVYLLAAFVTLVASNVWVYAAGRAVIAFTLGNSGLMLATLHERVPAKRVGLAFALMNGAINFGSFAGPLVGGPIVDAWGFPALLALDTFLLLVVVSALSFGYRDRYRSAQAEPLLRMARDSVRIIVGTAQMRALFAALLLLFTGMALSYTYIPVVVAALYRGGEPGAAVGLVFGASGLATLILSPLLGSLADRFGHWRVLFIGALVEIALWPLPALAADVASLAVLWALVYGVFSGVSSISFSVLANSVAPGVRGRVMAFAYLPVTVGFIVGPFLGSALAQVNVGAIFPGAAVVTAAGVAVLAAVYRNRSAGGA